MELKRLNQNMEKLTKENEVHAENLQKAQAKVTQMEKVSFL